MLGVYRTLPDLEAAVTLLSPTLWLSSRSPVEPQPILHYLCEDNLATTAVIDQTGAYPGTSTRNTSVFSTASGKVSRGFDFYTGSVEDGINCGNLGGLTDFSFAAWIAPDGAGGSSAGRIFDVDTNTPYFYATSSTTLSFTDGTNSITTDACITFGQWHHVVLTRSGSTGAVYVNGVARSLTPSGSGCPTTSITTTRVGNRNGGARYFDGKMDDIRIYNSALSPSQITDIYNKGTGHQNQAISNMRGAIVVDPATGKVNSWKSRAGTIEFNQTTAANRPTWTSTGITFAAASSQYMTSTALLSDVFTNAIKTLFVVVKHTTVGADQFIFHDSGWKCGMMTYADAHSTFGNSDAGGMDEPTLINPTVAGKTYVFEGVHGGGYLNGAANGRAFSAVASGNTTAVTGTLVLGSTSGSMLNGQIMEIIAANSTWTAEQRQMVRRYLAEAHKIDAIY